MDAVIGGPPFVRLQTLSKTNKSLIQKYRARYRTARHGQFDFYMLFFEQAIHRLRTGGWLGWSVSNSFLRSSSGRAVRGVISSNCSVHELVEFESRKVYPDAVTQIVLVLFEKGKGSVPCRHVWIKGDGGFRQKLASLADNKPSLDPTVRVCLLPEEACRSSKWSLVSVSQKNTLAKINEIGFPIKLLPIRLGQGVATGADSIYLVQSIRNEEDGMTLIKNRAGEDHLLESAILQPIVRSRDIRGFVQPAPKNLCIVPYESSGKLLTEQHFRSLFPLAYGYLQRYREQRLLPSPKNSMPWYAFQSSGSLSLPAVPKILLKKVCSGSDFTIDMSGQLLCHNSISIACSLAKRLDPYFLLGILNSSVFWTFVRSAMPTMGEGRHSLRTGVMRKFPLVIPHPRQSDARQERIQEIAVQLHADDVTALDREDLIDELDSAVAEMYQVQLRDLVRPQRRMSKISR